MKLDYLFQIWDWIEKDFRSYPLRFMIETTAWALSIGCSLVMAATVPTPPLLILYPVWITGCVMYAWAAWDRKSFGMLANYLVLVGIDSVGLLRMMIN